VAHLAAKVSIGNGNIEAAIEQLKLAPKNEFTLRSLAYLYARTNQLDVEIDKLNELPDRLVDKRWRNYLHLEKTNREEIRSYAQKHNLTGVVANLDLLDGDPSLMFEYYSDQAPFIAKIGLSVLKSQYEGVSEEDIKKSHEKQLKTLQLFEGNKPTELLNQTLKSLSLTGAKGLTDSYIQEQHKYEYFANLDRAEQPRKALAQLGITDDQSLDDFITDKTLLAIEEMNAAPAQRAVFEDVIETSHILELVNVADFYYRRGVKQKAKQVLTPLLEKLEADKSEAWYELVESIGHARMYDLAVEITLKKGDVDNSYRKIISALYDDTLDTELIWTTLSNREETPKDDSFRDLAVIMGVYQSEIKTYHSLQDELIKIATQKGNPSLRKMQSALLSAAMHRQDAISETKFSKSLLMSEEGEERIEARKIDYLRALSKKLDWNGIVELLDEDSSFIARSAKWYALYSIAKRKLGDEVAADKILSKAKLVSLGLNAELRDIAVEHSLAGYYNVYTDIMERILVVNSTDRTSDAYRLSFAYLSSSDNAYIHQQQWGKAASFLLLNSAASLANPPNNSEYLNIDFHNFSYYNAQFARGMELYKSGDKAKGLKMLTSAHKAAVGEGSLADHFWKTIRSMGRGISSALENLY